MPGQDPTSAVVDPGLAADPAEAAQAAVHAEYVQDQLQRVRTVTDHADALRRDAGHRIGAASRARASAGAEVGTLADYHVVRHLLDERAFYPPHDKRAESPAYARVHHQLTVVEDHRCLVCGVRRSTLGDATQNPFGAIQIETHHRTAEWALANAVDPAKFNQHIRPGLAREAQSRWIDPRLAPAGAAIHTAFDAMYARDMTRDEIHQWVDHAVDNLWPLCDVHHRHKYVGIHAITYPIWGPQDVVDAASVADQIALAHQKGGAPATPSGRDGAPAG